MRPGEYAAQAGEWALFCNYSHPKWQDLGPARTTAPWYREEDTMTEEPTRAQIVARGPYLTFDTTDIILFVPDMYCGDDIEEWREWLQYDGFMRLDDHLWFQDAGLRPDAELLKWRLRFDGTFPGVRQIDTEEEARLAEGVKREEALLIQRAYGSSRLFK